jgi:phosphonate transport system substrate-binding protein
MTIRVRQGAAGVRRLEGDTMRSCARLAALLIAALTVMPASAQELVLAINAGVTYHVTPQEIREKYKGLADLIGKELKRTVLVQPVDDYQRLRKGLDQGEYDLAFVHPAHHAMISERDKKYKLVVLTKGFTDYKAFFLVKKDSPLKKPEDLRGKKIGTPDPDSITAVITRAELRDLGVDTAKSPIQTTRYQDAVPFMVENGFVDAGSVGSAAIAKAWRDQGGRVLVESRPVPIKHFIASTKLSDGDIEKVRGVLLGLDQTPAGRTILEHIGFKGFVEGDEKELAVTAKWLGL